MASTPDSTTRPIGSNSLLTIPGPISPPPSPFLRPSSLWRLSSLDTLLDYQKSCSNGKRLTGDSSTLFMRDTSSIESIQTSAVPEKHFRCTAAEIGFCCSLVISQLLSEYLISGFSVMLPELRSVFHITGPASYWPASILSLLVCSTILTFARISDMYGGYATYMSALILLCLSTVVSGVTTSAIALNICRALQGISLAAVTPASYALIGTIYPSGPRRNIVLGFCSASAPLGLFTGMCVTAGLPTTLWPWYFWTASGLSITAFSLAYLCTPTKHSTSVSKSLSMDWAGAATITSSLILLAYALSASASSPSSWKTPQILVPLLLGAVLLATAIYIEIRIASSPLLPPQFFAPKSVSPFCVAALFLHASFGIWLFTSASAISTLYDLSGLRLAVAYMPLFLGGVTIALLGGAILHRVPITICLLLSALSWVAANLLLAFADEKKGYWAFVFPAMVCATLGIDGSFTISCVFLSSVQKKEMQGAAGAVGSLLVNLGIVLGLAGVGILTGVLSEGFERGNEEGGLTLLQQKVVWRSAFLFAAGCAGVGVGVVAVFVRISRGVVDGGTDVVRDEEAGGEVVMVESVTEITVVGKQEDA